MEHINITELQDGYKRLTPEDGYKLYNTITREYYSEAVVKDARPYTAVADGTADNGKQDGIKVFKNG